MGDDAFPLVLARAAVDGHRTVEPYSNGNVAGRKETDVPLDICVDERECGRRPAAKGFGELFPRSRAVQSKNRGHMVAVPDRVPSLRKKTPVRGVAYYDTVSRHPYLFGHRLSVFDGNRLGHDVEIDPLSVPRVLARILRVHRLEVDVLNVREQSRDTPRDPLVLTEDDERHPGNARAGNVEPPTAEMDLVEKRRHR